VGDDQCGIDAVGMSTWLVSMPLGVNVVHIDVAAVNVAHVDVAAVNVAHVNMADVDVARVDVADVDVACVDIADVDVAPSTWGPPTRLLGVDMAGRRGSRRPAPSFASTLLLVPPPSHPISPRSPLLCPIVVGVRGGR